MTATFDILRPSATDPFRERPRRYRRNDLRRVQLADGRTRAFINDQSISVQTLKAVGAVPVEIHGQHDERAGRRLDAPAIARRLCRAEKEVSALETLWEARRAATPRLTHRASMERAAREADYLRHAADELKTLKPKDGEETALAGRRTIMMQGEKIASDRARRRRRSAALIRRCRRWPPRCAASNAAPPIRPRWSSRR